MKQIRLLLVIVTAAVVFAVMATGVIAQTRSRTTGRGSRSTRTRAADNAASNAVRTGAIRVADQIKTLTRFLYLLGGVSRGIEVSDEAARRNEASPAIIEQTERSKATVKTSLQNVRQGLDDLEIFFRVTPGLEGYYARLAGVAAGAATAEEKAAANQYDAAGRSLLEVVNHLTDVLLEMH